MNEHDANDLINQIIQIIPAKEFLEAFNLGIEKYDAVIQGNQVISDFFRVNYEKRQFSSAIFDAFYSFSWSNPLVHAKQDSQGSSHRAYLCINGCMIDIVKGERMDSNFFVSRFDLNKVPGNDGERYLVLQYWITKEPKPESESKSEFKLERMRLGVPKSGKEFISSTLIYPEGR